MKAALVALVLLAGCDVAAERKVRSVPMAEKPAMAGKVKLVEFSPEGEPMETYEEEKLVLSEEEWRARLTPQAFSVLRHHGTEMAFTGTYNKNDQAGIYRCRGCGTALFLSKTKFDSGTGWPSFYAAAADENLQIRTDTSYGMSRDEVLCRRCDGHLGHVFPDGPEPTGLRYCMNSAALSFQPAGKK